MRRPLRDLNVARWRDAPFPPINRGDKTIVETLKSQPAPRLRATYHDTPLRAKVGALVAVAAIGGFALGWLSRAPGLAVWIGPAALTLLVGAVGFAARDIVWRPLENLVTALRRAEREPDHIVELPIHRRDEIGRIARVAQRILARARRHHREAHLIRRTLDVRVDAETEKAIHQLKRMAMRDALTDLGNRHFLEESLEPLFKSVKAADEDLVCLVIDVDNFKQLNDTLGHGAGDELLILLGDLIRGSTRREDYAVRLGGDEFVILLPGCPLSRGRKLAEQLVTLFRQHTRTTLPADLPVTLSIGIASAQLDRARDGEELMEIADRKLYAAKRAGKAQSVGA